MTVGVLPYICDTKNLVLFEIKKAVEGKAKIFLSELMRKRFQVIKSFRLASKHMRLSIRSFLSDSMKL